jgi:phospholipid transport system substrate-binding protein
MSLLFRDIGLAMKRLYLLITGFLIILASGAFATSQGPMNQMKTTIDAMLVTLKDHSMDQASRRQKLRSLILARLDLRSMSQRVLAQYWRKATDPQKERFTELFTDLLSRSYISNIEAYTDERVDYVGERLKGDRYALVKTVIVTKDTDIPINYKMHRNKGGEWLAYDVLIEEVSLVSTYRSSYQEIARNQGIDGLLTRMEQKLAKTPPT